MESPVNASGNIFRRTSQPQNLTAMDVVRVTEAIVRLTEEATVNPEVIHLLVTTRYVISLLSMANTELMCFNFFQRSEITT